MNHWETLSNDARVWLYGANRKLSETEQRKIQDMLDTFCESWAAHGAKLDCGYTILYNQLIILAVDEKSAAASGCSIDSSVKVFREIDAKYELDLFNRLRSYHLREGQLVAHHSSAIKQLLESNELTSQSLFIDPLIGSKYDVLNNLTKPLKETWLNKYLPTTSV